MKIIILLSIFISVLTALFAGYAKADSPADSAAKAKPTEVPAPVHLTRREIMDKLQVTKEQRRLLQENRASYRKKIAVIEGQIKVKKVVLESELEKPEPDTAVIDQVTSDIGVLLGQKYSTQIKAELEVEKKILTPPQAEQLKTLQGRE